MKGRRRSCWKVRSMRVRRSRRRAPAASFSDSTSASAAFSSAMPRASTAAVPASSPPRVSGGSCAACERLRSAVVDAEGATGGPCNLLDRKGAARSAAAARGAATSLPDASSPGLPDRIPPQCGQREPSSPDGGTDRPPLARAPVLSRLVPLLLMTPPSLPPTLPLGLQPAPVLTL